MKKVSLFRGTKPTVKRPSKSIIMITRLQNAAVLYCLLLAFSICTSTLRAETKESRPYNKEKSVFDVLHTEDILEVRIETKLSILVENRRSEEYQKGMFTYEDSEGEERELVVKLRPRGKYRRRICDFPPLKLKFPKKHLAAAGIAPKFNDLKLVTHCLDGKAISKENVVKELLAYKLYQELTGKSYRVQLVKITYVDTNRKSSKIKRYGFLIEDTDQLMARLGSKEYELLNPDPSFMAVTDENVMAVFQYMIGNSDWNLAMLRNVKLAQPKNGGEIIPVPYDFDFSGLVYTSYARPNVDYGLTSVRERVFLGLPVDDEVLRSTFDLFKQKRSSLEQIIRGQKGLSRSSKADVLNYIASFYNSLDDIVESNERNLYAALKSTVSPEKAETAQQPLGK